jgi:hypothetical protein
MGLRNEYSEGVCYAEHVLTAHADKSIINGGFMGAGNVVFLSSLDLITHEAPGCIAAPLVNMVAKNVIGLGMVGQGSQPIPVRLYAPELLSMTAKHLAIGEIRLLAEPKHGLVSCKKLTLSKSTEEDPDHFEIVKSWVISDDVEVETARDNFSIA